jgi:hypothetical protein
VLFNVPVESKQRSSTGSDIAPNADELAPISQFTFTTIARRCCRRIGDQKGFWIPAEIGGCQ